MMHDFCIEIAVSWKWNQKIWFFARFQNHHSRSLFAIYIWCFHLRKYVNQFHFWKYSQPPSPHHLALNTRFIALFYVKNEVSFSDYSKMHPPSPPLWKFQIPLPAEPEMCLNTTFHIPLTPIIVSSPFHPKPIAS